MRKHFCLALLAIFLAYLPEIRAQDEYPVIVGAPQVSVTVFTNWQLIKLTYTIGYLDGYQPNFEEARPENMSFGLEIDQEKGSQLVRLNKRRYKNENYEDLVYYVRHIGEKKGEIIIPEQTFHYLKEEPGQSSEKEGQLVYEAKAPGVVLRYDSVLTKEANDIIDVINFGSFQDQEKFWKGAAAGIILLAGLSVFLLFCWPAVAGRMGFKPKAVKDQKSDTAEPLNLPERLTPKQALGEFIKDLLDRQKSVSSLEVLSADIRLLLDREERARLANQLKELLEEYVPDVLDSDTPTEIQSKIQSLPDGQRYKKPLSSLADKLVYLDGLFYGQKPSKDLLADLRDALTAGQDLRRADTWRERIKVWFKNMTERRKK